MEISNMTHDETVKHEITRLMELQRIKASNNGAPNKTLDACITESINALHALGLQLIGKLLEVLVDLLVDHAGGDVAGHVLAGQNDSLSQPLS